VRPEKRRPAEPNLAGRRAVPLFLSWHIAVFASGAPERAFFASSAAVFRFRPRRA
jgi:hypothetical protein